MHSMSYEPLSPVSFLRRSASVFANRTAVLDGDRSLSYAELWERSRSLAGMLAAAGVDRGDRVGVLAPNSEMALTAHFAVPLAAAVLVPLNFRLTATELAFILDRSGVELLLCTEDLRPLALDVAAQAAGEVAVFDEGEVERGSSSSAALELALEDELELLSINYTSGTTGVPKGAMYHYRGAYLQGLAMAFHAGLDARSVFLWIVPMFHCHGWCFTWGATAAGATHLCLRKVEPAEIWDTIECQGVTHLAAAPTVLTALANHPDARLIEGRVVKALTGGSPPSPTLLARLGELGIDVTHLYGLTESYGPMMLCDWDPSWDELSLGQRARRKARQGVNNVIAEAPRIVDGDGVDVPADGATMGELVLRGNDLMLGYYDDEEATAAAQLDGWFRTGDVGVRHSDGYVELRDRSKDMIVSGGENITSVEVEQAIASHPAVLEVAVVGVPDAKWGERPAAYVTLKDGASADEEEIIGHVRGLLASYKAPREVVFVDKLPKTSTGKILKYGLRETAWQGRDRNIA